jgi:hypothetical protein
MGLQRCPRRIALQVWYTCCNSQKSNNWLRVEVCRRPRYGLAAFLSSRAAAEVTMNTQGTETDPIRSEGTMVSIGESINIHRPLAHVFDFVSSSDNDFEWQYGTLASGRTSEGAAAVGGSFRSVGHLMGRRMVSTFEITEYVSNLQYGFRSLTGPLVSHTLYTLKGSAGRTRIQIDTQASPADGERLSRRGMERYMKKELKDNLAMLKTIMEAPRARGLL